METEGLAAVATGEGPNLNEPPGLPPTTNVVYNGVPAKKNLKGAAIHEKWELESRPRGRQQEQNWLNTTANVTFGTVTKITDADPFRNAAKKDKKGLTGPRSKRGDSLGFKYGNK